MDHSVLVSSDGILSDYEYSFIKEEHVQTNIEKMPLWVEIDLLTWYTVFKDQANSVNLVQILFCLYHISIFVEFSNKLFIPI